MPYNKKNQSLAIYAVYGNNLEL